MGKEELLKRNEVKPITLLCIHLLMYFVTYPNFITVLLPPAKGGVESAAVHISI